MKPRKNKNILLHDEDLDLINAKYLIAEKPYRFIILISTALILFSNGYQWSTFASIATNFEKNYNLSRFEVNLLSNFYGISYLLMTFPSFYIIEKKNVKIAVKVASLLTLIGGFLKSFINTHIIYAYIGQILCAIAQPLVLNSTSKIANLWFRPERV
jgi:fucose permease